MDKTEKEQYLARIGGKFVDGIKLSSVELKDACERLAYFGLDPIQEYVMLDYSLYADFEALQNGEPLKDRGEYEHNAFNGIQFDALLDQYPEIVTTLLAKFQEIRQIDKMELVVNYKKKYDMELTEEESKWLEDAS